MVYVIVDLKNVCEWFDHGIQNSIRTGLIIVKQCASV